ncbi:hypothetical protein M422DRAFT_775954 [Sphaerobolus stellatus SS14]|nr:hypothetical protein M422DRAFT_775954 [Sphaerobolus stellatus SS14]
MPFGFGKNSNSNTPPAQPQPSQFPHSYPQAPPVGSNYQPIYIPHPAGVPDPYARPVEPPITSWIIPRLSIRIEDLANPGAAIFLKHIKPYEAMRNAVIRVHEVLYTVQTQPRNVASVTLILRDFDGVAHTHSSAGSEADKEIHFSTRHIKGSESRAEHEILGVLLHEMVHCFQYNAKGTCPGGFIEGIADFVRLRSSLGPPHWKRSIPQKWDVGYDGTAFFLDWVEQTFGMGTVRALNEGMRKSRYDGGRVWIDVTGQTVDNLFIGYKTTAS